MRYFLCRHTDKLNVIWFNQKTDSSWSLAREAYRAISRDAKVSSVLNQVFAEAEAEDIEDDEKPFQLKCKVCKRNCQLNNPSKWKKEHNCSTLQILSGLVLAANQRRCAVNVHHSLCVPVSIAA